MLMKKGHGDGGDDGGAYARDDDGAYASSYVVSALHLLHSFHFLLFLALHSPFHLLLYSPRLC